MEKRHKQLAIGVAVVAGLYFFPTIMRTTLHVAATHNPSHIEKPNPEKPIALANLPTVPIPNPPAVTDTPADPKYSALLGKYMGGAVLKTRECKGNLELGAKPDKADEFTGYITLICFAPLTQKGISPLVDPVTALSAEYTPASAILTGKVENGVIQLHSDKTIQTLADGCPITGLSVQSFGPDQLAVDWQEGACQGGQLIFHKS